MSDPADLAMFWEHGWKRLRARIAARRSDARFVSIATVAPDGWPETRTVALRAANPADPSVDVYTDAASAKIAALAADPRAQLLAWDPDVNLQIRLFTRVEVLQGNTVAEDWNKMPDISRVSYGKVPLPGHPIDGPHDYRVTSDPAMFRVLRCRVERIDLVELEAIHRRAVFQRGDGWRGQWVVP